jgi:cation:H+ antiporter
MVVNVFSSLNGKDELILGNIIGSNLFNTLVILGIAAFIYPITVKKATALFEIPYSLLATIVVAVLANDVFLRKASINSLTRIDGFIFLGFFIIFILYVIRMTLKDMSDEDEGIPEMSLPKSSILVLLGLIGLTLGGKLVVDNAVLVAKGLGVSDALIGLTILAAGTSLPELITAIVAARKKKSDIVIGNVIGSNIFNIFLVLATSSIIAPIKFDDKLNIDLVVLSVGGILLFLFMFWGKKDRVIDKREGSILIALYLAYFIYMMIRM